MVSTPGVSLIDGAAGGNTTSGNGSRNAINGPHLRPRQPFSLSPARRSSRSTPNRYRGYPPMTLGGEASGSYEKKRKAPMEETPHGISEAVKVCGSAPLMPRDPNRTCSSKDGAKGRLSEHAMVGSARSSTKKRKCMPMSNYLSQFKPPSKVVATAVVVRSEQSSIPPKTNKVKESPFQKLQRLPDGCHPDFDNDHLCSVNKLREFWHKSQGAVFVDDKEHVMKTILFILSVLPDACQPFLLLTNASLPLWEAEFSRFAPSINIIVYDGEKDVHKLVQNPEFHENGRHTMLHVVLAHPDAILENIKNLECIGWEAVIVDYCQSSVLKHLKKLKQLPTDFRVVLLSSPLKDNLLEYKNLLAFLNSEQEDNGAYVDADALAMLRARFTRHIAYERKTASSKFLEYWVPAYLSQVQLELYSSVLLANSSILQSQTATDSVGALRDIVMCLWKCCNHPCLVGLQHSLANTCDVTESTDGRMHESGKLLLLEKMIKEIRDKRLRVIVLFQSDGAVGDGMGNILEEFVRQKFGPDSYERVQNRSAFSVKQEAMNMFNDTTKERFVFLIDSRACHSSINLSSVDTIIIYGSDLNPLNDLKALRKIKIESQLKYVRIFRLYTPFTVEEKGLVLAKQSMIIDSNGQDILSSLSHCLLSWGISFLFSRIEDLQQDNCASKSCERNTVLMMDKVLLEFLTELSTDIEDSRKINSAIISKACMSGEFYSRNIILIGEREGVSSLDGDPPKFWLKLLNGKSRCQRNEPIKVPTEETNEARRKLSKTGEIAGSSSKFSSDATNNNLFPETGTPSSADVHLLPEAVHSEGMENRSTPKSLHAELKRELSKLIKVLKLPDNVCFKAKQLLEYALKNHLVPREPQGILHAINMALCWRAASLLKYSKLDHQESLALAADRLNYEYNKELVDFFYKKLGNLGGRRNRIQNDRFSPHESSSVNLRSGHISPKQAMDLHGNFTDGTQESLSAAEQMVSDGQELVSSPEANRECHLSSEEPPGRTATKRIDLFNNIFSLREKNILEKQQLEILKLTRQRGNQILRLKEVCHAVVHHIRISDIDEEVRKDQIKLVIEWFTMFMLAFFVHMKLQLAVLDALQSKTWVKEQMMKEELKQEVLLSGQLDKLLDLCNTLPDSDFVIEEFVHFKKQIGDYHVDNSLDLGCDQLLDDRLMEVTLVRNLVPSEAQMTSGAGAASESVDLPDDNTHCSSDGTELQRACSASIIPASHDSINQESSTVESRSIEHAKRDNIADPSMLPGIETSLVKGTNADDDGTVAADPDHLHSPILASPRNLMTLQHSSAEAEPADPLLAMTGPDLQTELQTSCPTLDTQHQMMYPDDSSQMNLERDTTSEILQEGTTSDPLGDSSMGFKDKNVDTAAADPLNSENQSYVAPHNTTVSPDAWEAETQIDQSSLPAQQNLVILGHPPAEAEPSSNLDTDAAWSLQPDIQPSSLMLDADSSQTRCQPETSPVLSQGGSTYHHLADGRMEFVDNNGAVCAHQVHSESSTFAAPQSTMLPFSSEVGTHANLSIQRMLLDDRSQTCCRPDKATDLSEEGETEYLSCATCNLATLPVSSEAETENGQASMPAQEIRSPHAQHSLATLQLTVDDLQPQTSILPEEEERAGMLCTTAARDLQHGMQPSVTAQDLQPEVQTSSPMHDQPAEAEGAGTSRITISAQNSQFETQPPTSVQHIPPERTHPDERIQIGLQSNTTLGPEHFPQLFTVPPAASNNFLCSSEPLRNELERLNHAIPMLSKEHEKKKSQLQTECNQEMEKIMKKYESLLQEENYTYHRLITALNDNHRKVFVQHSLAENFREKFMKSTPAQERSASPRIRQAPQPFPQASSSTSATRPPALTSFHSTGPCVQPSQMVRPSAIEAVHLYRTTPSPVGSMPVRNGSFRAAGTQSRGPVPILQQLQQSRGTQSPSAIVRGDRQQLALNPGITSSRQYAPGLLESFASVRASGGAPLTSTAAGSVQQAMPSASNSLPPFPGSAPVSMANFVQSPSTIPFAMAAQQAPGLIPGLHHMPSGPLNGAAGIWQAGGHLAGTNQAAPEPSPDALRLLQRQWGHAMAPPSSVQQTVTASASNPHPGPSSTNRYLLAVQQALFQNPALGNVAGQGNAAAGVWQHGAALPAVASQPAARGPSSSNAQPGVRTGPQTSGARAQGGSGEEVVCLSDDDE
ncbi:uncharacterized protein C2845_PM11G12100 [Panicum miliaceum]|uniref:Uncharacterized protein n=1 Tax=Panicum miliaceum TaxID=4540 RepID=A0A3L6RQ98_PANMI|nr:uncharacterized protein C2845_PM11G12100 [Panicum miliaceum]